MFGCLPLDGPHREGGLLAGLRTYLPLSRTTLTQQFFGSAPQISTTLPQRHRQFCASSSLTEGTRALDVAQANRGKAIKGAKLGKSITRVTSGAPLQAAREFRHVKYPETFPYYPRARVRAAIPVNAAKFR